ncbi:hypothetical protein B0H11DRAFT_1920247 [Mycena galericulata]|nr:hypothetical protein B0H11DRAFT_1920247 [Mycena galericulata]
MQQGKKKNRFRQRGGAEKFICKTARGSLAQGEQGESDCEVEKSEPLKVREHRKVSLDGAPDDWVETLNQQIWFTFYLAFTYSQDKSFEESAGKTKALLCVPEMIFRPDIRRQWTEATWHPQRKGKSGRGESGTQRVPDVLRRTMKDRKSSPHDSKLEAPCGNLGGNLQIVLFWLWPLAKKPWLFGFGTKAKAKPKSWPDGAFGLACPSLRPKPGQKAKASGPPLYKFDEKPWLRPKPGQAKPRPIILAWPGISASQSHSKPGQSHGFQAKPKPEHHYLQKRKWLCRPERRNCYDLSPPLAPPPFFLLYRSALGNLKHCASSRQQLSASGKGAAVSQSSCLFSHLSLISFKNSGGTFYEVSGDVNLAVHNNQLPDRIGRYFCDIQGAVVWTGEGR